VNKQLVNKYLKYSSLGLQMVIFVAIFVIAGRELDQRAQTSKPWFTLTGALLGSVAAMVWLIQRLKRF
jgi:hypothetical protein